MKTHSLIYFDKYLGLPAAVALNIIVRLLGKLLHINHNLDRKFERIAIVKYKGLGSIIQATALIKTLKMNFPESKLCFITSIQNKAIIEKIPELDHAIYFIDRSLLRIIFQLPLFLLKLMRSKFQLLFDLEVYSNVSSIISTLSCATNRFGFYRSSSQYRMGLYTHMMFFNTSVPLSQCYLQMARILKPDNIHESLIIFTDSKPGNIAEHIDQSRPFILLNPNASDLRIERRWDINSFGRLIDSIREKYMERQIVLIGSRSEQKYVKELIEKVTVDRDSLIDLSGKTTLDQLIWLITNSELFITCDTGPAHIAYSQQACAVVLFGPVNPIQFRIPGNIKVIYKHVYCSPCVHEFDIPPCKGNNQCMKLIEVSEVLQAVSQLISPEVSKNESKQEHRFTDETGNVLGRVMR